MAQKRSNQPSLKTGLTTHPNITLDIKPNIIIIYFFLSADNNHDRSRTQNCCFTSINNISKKTTPATLAIIKTSTHWRNLSKKTITTRCTINPNITLTNIWHMFFKLFKSNGYNHNSNHQSFHEHKTTFHIKRLAYKFSCTQRY